MPEIDQKSPLFILKQALFDAKQPYFMRYLYTLNNLTAWVDSKNLYPAISMLRDDENLLFDQLIDITAVDYPERENRFDVVYHFLSTKFGWRLRVKAETSEDQPVASLVRLYPSAGWWEREAWDMFGILFEGNPDHRRLLTDYDFEGHPLRKDFPVIGHYQVAYDSEKQKVVREPVNLAQDFRDYDFKSPWEGVGQLFDKVAKKNNGSK